VGNFGVFGTAVAGWNETAITVRRCVLFENGSGWVAQGDVAPSISCTDIYGHTSGNWRPPIHDQEGVDGNQSADPLFCWAGGLLSPFQLDGASPCAPINAPAGCGGLGAWGVGCGDVTPVPETPAVTRLHPPHPNPFNPATTLNFELARASRATLRIYAVDGRRIATLVDEELPAGRHERLWQGRDGSGRRVASGLYFCRLLADGVSDIQRLTLVK